MPTRTAGENADVLEAFPNFVAESDVFEMNAAGVQRKPSEDRVLDGDRLLVNLLEHEMLVAALLGHDRIPRDVLELRLAVRAGPVHELDSVACDNGNLIVVKKQNRSSVAKHRRNVRGD